MSFIVSWGSWRESTIIASIPISLQKLMNDTFTGHISLPILLFWPLITITPVNPALQHSKAFILHSSALFHILPATQFQNFYKLHGQVDQGSTFQHQLSVVETSAPLWPKHWTQGLVLSHSFRLSSWWQERHGQLMVVAVCAGAPHIMVDQKTQSSSKSRTGL